MRIALSSLWNWPFPAQWFEFYQILDQLSLGIEWNPRKGDMISLNRVYSCHYLFSDKPRDKFIFRPLFRRWDRLLITEIKTLGVPVVVHPLDLIKDWKTLYNIWDQLVLELKFDNKFRTINDILSVVNNKQIKMICIDIGYLIQYLFKYSGKGSLTLNVDKVIGTIKEQGLIIRVVHIWDWRSNTNDVFGKSLLLGQGNYSEVVRQVLYQIISANSNLELLTFEFGPNSLKPWLGKKTVLECLLQSIKFLRLGKYL